MKYLVIRDDDLSYWSRVEEIDLIYKPLFEKGIKVSFAVIPKAVRMYNAGDFDLMYQDEYSATFIGENVEIVKYIKNRIKEGLVEIMLHGYNHLYSLKVGDMIYRASKENIEYLKQNGEKFEFIGEYIGDYETLFEKTKKGKEYLEDLFEVKVKNFVPPSNQIDKEGVRAVYENNLNISGIMEKKFNREINFRSVAAYLKMARFKMKYPNLTYPYIIDYKTHKELAGYAFTPSTDWERYENQFLFCKEHNLPFQIATHYWELKDELLDRYYDFINKALDRGYKSVFLREILN